VSNVVPKIAKGQIYKFEHQSAANLAEESKNARFGFKCLHYSVSESSKFLEVAVLNKTGAAGAVRVKTRDDTATGGEDYKSADEILQFKAKDESKTFKVEIIDDEGWEPDEDFYIDLLETEGDIRLDGADTSCRVTIIDDDKPGSIGFEQTKGNVLAVANTGKAEVVLIRKNGSDGVLTVEF
jgi:hypothetical protein